MPKHFTVGNLGVEPCHESGITINQSHGMHPHWLLNFDQHQADMTDEKLEE